MTDYIALGTMLLIVALWAITQVEKEDQLIQLATLLGKPVDHGRLLVDRIVFLGVCVVIMSAPLSTLWLFFPLAGLTWASLTILHRLLLNKARKVFPWWYLSTSNVYDRFWLGLTGGRVKPAGIAAYCFELTVFAASVWAYIWIVNT